VAAPQTPFTAALERIAHPRRLVPSFVFALAVLVAVGVFTWRSIDRLDETREWVERSHAVLHSMEALDSSLREAAASERAFVITGYQDYRAAHLTAAARAARRLTELGQLVADNPAQARRIDQLEPLANEALEFLRRVVETRRYTSEEAAARLVTSGDGERTLQQVLAALDQAEVEERTLLTQRIEQAGQRTWVIRRNLAIAGIAAGGLLLLAGFLVRRDVHRRVQVAGELTDVSNRLAESVLRAQRRADDIARLAELGQLLQTCQLPEEAYRVIEKAMPSLVRRGGGLFLVNAANTMLEMQASWGEVAQLESVFGPADCWALRRNRPHDFGADPASPRCSHLLGLDHVHSTCMPLMGQGESLGVLVLIEPLDAVAEQNENDEEGEDRRTMLSATAEQIALALANLRLRDSLKSQSIRDPLTELFNRRFLEESLARECRRSIRANRPVSVLMLDIDHFKRFNDTFGHEAGDTVLREFGSLLRSSFRGEDVACRYGGEEFALVLADTSIEGALMRASQLRDQVHQLSITFRRQTLAAISVSVGIASLPYHASTADALLRAADRALYRAKHEGRDRIVVADLSDAAESAMADTGFS
jgi:diguanylate cyclase (GGDEF)-like protein